MRQIKILLLVLLGMFSLVGCAPKESAEAPKEKAKSHQ